MGKGEQLHEVQFSPDVHRDLRKILVDLEARRRAALIIRLGEIAAIAPALAAPDVKAARRRLEVQRDAARRARRALDRGGDLVENLLTCELSLRGWDGAKFMASLRAGLVELEHAIAAIEARRGERRGGAPADSASRWLVEETERALTESGVRVTHQIGGTLARILEVLWPPILKRQAPLDLRPWFKTLKSRR
jgi:hypothetical protein